MLICGGASRRFGANKLMAPLDGRPVLTHVIERVRPQAGALAINGPAGLYEGVGLPVIPDRFENAGPLAGIWAAMRWAAELGAEAVLTASGDTPFLPEDWATRLTGQWLAGQKGVIAVPRVGAQAHFLCSLWPVALQDELRVQLQTGQNRRVGDFIASHRHRFVAFERTDGIDPFFNINTKADLARAEAFVRMSKDRERKPET